MAANQYYGGPPQGGQHPPQGGPQYPQQSFGQGQKGAPNYGGYQQQPYGQPPMNQGYGGRKLRLGLRLSRPTLWSDVTDATATFSAPQQGGYYGPPQGGQQYGPQGGMGQPGQPIYVQQGPQGGGKAAAGGMGCCATCCGKPLIRE